MNQSPARDFVVGLFVLAGLGAIAYLSLTIGGLSFVNRDTLKLYAAFDQIGGLKSRAPVVIAGVKVGQVGPIRLDKDFRAKVELDLDSRLKIPIDTSASILTSGLLGDQYIELQLGGDEKYLKPGEQISFTESAVILERLLGELIHDTDIGASK